MRKMMALLATTAVASLLALTTGQQSWAQDLAKNIRAQVNEAVEEAEKAAERSRSGNAESDAPAGRAVLKVSGDRGTQFSGACAVGDDERTIGGEVPRTYAYDLDGRRIECEIRNEGDGDLRIVFDSGDAHSEQSVSPEGAIVELIYEDGVFVTSSSSSSHTSVQNSSSTTQVTTSRP